MTPATTAAVLRPAAPRPAPERAPGRRLHAVPVPAPRRRPRMGYAVVAFGGAVAIAIAQMGLSVLTTQSSYELAALNQERRDATLQAQELRDEVAGLGSPQHLASKAAGLGLVIAGAPSYLRLSDGSISGSGEAAGAVSTVDVAGRAAVGNALLNKRPVVTAESAAAALAAAAAAPAEEAAAPAEGDQAAAPAVEAPPEQPAPELPPPITEGLPSPTTR